MIEFYRILKTLPDLDHRHLGWCDGQMILALMLLNIAGYDRVGDIERLECDVLFARCSENQNISFSVYPLARSMPASGVSGTAYIPVPSVRYGPLTVAWKRLIAVAVREAKILIDMMRRCSGIRFSSALRQHHVI